MKWASPISFASLRWYSPSIISCPRTLCLVGEIYRLDYALDRSADTLDALEKGSDVARDEPVFFPREARGLQETTLDHRGRVVDSVILVIVGTKGTM